MKPSSPPILFAPIFPQLEKPLLVMFPGLDGTGKLFVSQVESISRHFDVRCLSIPDENRQDWDALANAVLDLIHDARRGRPTFVCGESYGGCLALKVVMTAPEVIDRLIVINPASALRRQPWLRWSTQAAPYVPDWLYNASGRLALPLLANFDRIAASQQQLFVETIRSVTQECVLWRLSMLHQFEASPEHLKRLSMPTALLASGRDRLFPSLREVGLLKEYLPNAVTHYLPDSGHVCLLEEDVDLADCLKTLDFLPEASSTRLKES